VEQGTNSLAIALQAQSPFACSGLCCARALSFMVHHFTPQVPIPNVGSGSNSSWVGYLNGPGTQFQLPSVGRRAVRAPSPLSGYTMAFPFSLSWPDAYNPGFNDWTLVDRLRVPGDLPPGPYVLSFRCADPFAPRQSSVAIVSF
jgi:hypothetical protein